MATSSKGVPGTAPAKPQLKFQLDDVSLFGNDAADLESEQLFLSYALKRRELAELVDGERAIGIVRAYKGEGKSALLRLVTSQLSGQEAEELVVSALGPDHSPALDSIDSDLWTREWKKRLLRLVAVEIGSRIGTAFDDDAISLVEEAEANGFKRRSLVSAIVDRIKSRVVPIEKSRVPVADYEQLVKRYLNSRPLIWLVVDDIDQNFSNTERWRVKLASFFTACRQIVSVIPELRIRTAVRPNVWSIVKREFESLSHLEQYMLDLTWTQTQFRQLLANRVKSYLRRTAQWTIVRNSLPFDTTASELALISSVFAAPMPWGGSDRTAQPHLGRR